MAVLTWDQTKERIFQTGIDRGVLYLHDGRVAVWNGLTEMEESSNSELKSFYLDGVKYLENLSPGDFQGKLKAYTYPDEFDSVNGITEVAPGLDAYEQPPSSFNLSYRTRLGNPIDGIDYGYEIHILYNVIAKPESYAHPTLGESGAQAVEFSWTLTGTPPKILKFRPTVHISIDSTKTPPDILKLIEDIIWGTATTDPMLPPITEIADIFGYLGALIIIDHGDGSWSAIDESETYITMVSDTEFRIDDANATYLDEFTYKVSSTNAGEALVRR